MTDHIANCEIVRRLSGRLRRPTVREFQCAISTS